MMSSHSSVITRGHAACIILEKAYNQENEAKCLAEVDDFPIPMELCHAGNQLLPVLLPAAYLNSHRAQYWQYRDHDEEVSAPVAREPSPEVPRLYGNRDLVIFMDEAFLSVSPQPSNTKVYTLESMSMVDIYELLKKYTSRFEDKDDPLKSFGYWCKDHKPSFTKAAIKRVRAKRNDGSWSSTRKRNIYVLAEKHWGKEIESIVKQLDLYHEQVQKWKREKYTLIGYARKSARPATDKKTRAECLNRMVDVLATRSDVDMTYVSWATSSSSPLFSRDDDAYDVQSVCSCAGDTQDMLARIRLERNPVVIVSITYAGLTTNSSDLTTFLQCHKNVKYLVVDNYAVNGKFDVLCRDDILSSPAIFERFQCRTATHHRSR